ncbi:hypothetical protein [Arthrobacter sp. GMC3]|uniref:hypothetical protein n=1 Tax=Arthrobacter sp. GMC3 TaxID=2058894 RepID=UPI000CE4CF93|nr:hypothetical protein [Arthrobacter sp. GMC3]
MTGIEVKGARQLQATMRSAGKGLTDFTTPNRDAADIAARASAALAPVRSGRLQRTIRASGSRTAAIIRAGNSTVPYAPPIHWGWPGRNIIPQPFLSDGAQDSEGRWIPVYEDYVDEYLHTIEGA